ncbi:MAG: helix-turn-helix domain-containing protein [Oscillospiraceae bacterium]|nr:helix-turn-helix domain-containing protein [Oscillospiraceae bacterium]
MRLELIELMQDASEIVQYERDDVRLYIRVGKLSAYPDLRAPCHWHEDLECIRVLNGSMRYFIDGETILLREGDSLIVNSRRMHYGFDNQGGDCEFSCVLFHPSALTGSEALRKSDLTPVLKEQSPGYWHFTTETAFGRETAEILDRIAALKKSAPDAYEWEVIGLLHILWGRLRRRMEELPNVPDALPSDMELQRNMVAFIYKRYQDKLTLADIAAAGHVSRSKCCQMFRRYLRRTPIEYLNEYRLKVAACLLRDSPRSVTDIALSCGFRHLSYFSRTFFTSYGCTPGDYRKLSVRALAERRDG